MKSKNLLFAITLVFFFLNAQSQPQIQLLPFASGFSNPVDIASAGDERLFVVQQRGLIRVINPNGTLNTTPFLDMTEKVSQSGNERGLLGLAFHPQYSANGFFFLNYTRTSDGATVVARFSVVKENPDQANIESEKVLLIIDQPYTNHNGGNLLFGPDGYLYIAVGDGGSGGDPQNYAQNHTSLLGKMLRIDVDSGDPYGIPEDNPFAMDDFTRDEIWALGLRNHWRNSFDRYTGDLWIADVGQGAREEINFQSASSPGGENYGWRCYEGLSTYNLEDCGEASFYTFPVFEYAHYGTSCTGSVTGGYVYRGALYNSLFGKYIAADYCKGEFYFVQQTDDGFESGSLGVFSTFQYSSFGQDQFGELYLALRGSGQVQKLTENSDCKPVAKIWEEGPLSIAEGSVLELNAFYHPTLEYQWFRNEQEITGANSSTLEVSEFGVYTVQVTNPANECSNLSEPVEVLVEEPTRISQNVFDQIRIYPNPATDMITVEGLPSSGETHIQLFDIMGRRVISKTIHNQEKWIHEVISATPGIYILKISNDHHQEMRKILIGRGKY